MAESREPGVWETDAPAGYVGIVVYDARGLAMRIEIRETQYRPEMAQPLRQWAMQLQQMQLLR